MSACLTRPVWSIFAQCSGTCCVTILPFGVLLPRVRWNSVLIGIAALVMLLSLIMLMLGRETLFSVLCDGVVIFGLWRTCPRIEDGIAVEPDVMGVTQGDSVVVVVSWASHQHRG